MKRVIQLYKNAYGGLSDAAWVLALVMLINRAGGMVIPFMSVYLTMELKFTVERTGIILSIFGLGSMAGSFLGGWLTDRFGQFHVQLTSLTLGGFMFLILGQITQFEFLAIWIFLLSMVTDSLRPANASSIALYARPENLTRAFSLNRMAINLGFSIGPALGGVLAAISYQWLFLGDGITCIFAGLLFFFFFRNRKTYKPVEQKKTATLSEKMNLKKSAWHDGRFLLFALCCMLFAIVLFQLFSTLPLYYREVYKMKESSIGILIGINGIIVFLFEMIIVYLIGNRFGYGKLIALGTLFIGVAMVMLNFSSSYWILYASMIVMSIAEILAMPFMVTYTIKRSSEKTRGSYMGLYSLSYASAFVIAPFLGTKTIVHLGYEWLWWLTGIIASIAALGFYLILKSDSGKTEEELKTTKESTVLTPAIDLSVQVL
ncbi:MAG: MFS transporter [Bacteroidetes bacterium]|nr:MFS transporter [Bacteroidota bacterium]HET6243125.1 MFS transporter [Bacteroidia bacterium]